jgi:hypothetical protein
MTTWLVTVYSPYDLSESNIRVEAEKSEDARKAAIGRTTTDLHGNSFEIDNDHIISVYPFRAIQALPYKTYQTDPAEKPPSWLLGAEVIEDRPLPLGARPVGSPTLSEIIPNALTTILYLQPVSSPDYPEMRFHIQYRRDIFTKFLQEAKRIKKQGKIPEAVLYLVEHAPGITVRMIADLLEIGYWTAYREVAKYAKPTKEQAQLVLGELSDSAQMENWLPKEQEERTLGLERLFALPKTEMPKVVLGQLWRKQVTLYPVKPKSENELLAEARRIYTLEGFFPNAQEMEKIREQIQRQTDAQRRQSIEFYLSKKSPS